MTAEPIITLLCPETPPVEYGNLWGKFPVNRIAGCRYLYYCANMEIAAEILVNQIQPFLGNGEGYFTIFPLSDTVDVNGADTVLQPTFSVVHYGCYRSFRAEAIARTHVTQLLEMFRESQNRYISSIRVTNTAFNKWSDDNSVVEQYTATVSVRAVTPYALAKDCPR